MSLKIDEAIISELVSKRAEIIDLFIAAFVATHVAPKDSGNKEFIARLLTESMVLCTSTEGTTQKFWLEMKGPEHEKSNEESNKED